MRVSQSQQSFKLDLTTPLSCQTSVLLLSHSNIPWNFGCGHGPSRSCRQTPSAPKKLFNPFNWKKPTNKRTSYEDLVFQIAWGIWFLDIFWIPQICRQKKFTPASPMMWMFTLDNEFLKPGLGEIQLHKASPSSSYYLFKCCFLDAKFWELLNHCTLTIHLLVNDITSAFDWRPQRWNDQLWNPKQPIAAIAFSGSQDCRFSRMSHLQQSHCLSSWWTIFFDYQAMSRIMLASSPPPGDGPRSRSAKT